MKLSQNTLSDLPQTVLTPSYDRDLLQAGILHVGVGNFHRAHQAVYLNDLLNAQGDPAWGILGSGVCAPDAKMRATLLKQDCLSTVVEIDADGLKAEVVGAMIGFLAVQPQGNQALIDAMCNPKTRIISLTVTEGGYYINSAGHFDIMHPSIAADITGAARGNTVFGAIVMALATRKAQDIAPFTVMSCDNIPGNGDITRSVVLGIANVIDPDLGNWIAEHVCFPNSMVDRITPATNDLQRDILQQRFGLIDLSPVFCEPFRQWVLEDKFSDGRPELEAVGVTFTDDIHEFEAMKIRILNGGHAILAYPAGLLGIEFAHDAMASALIKAFLTKVLQDDVLPYVQDVPGYTPKQYLELIIDRFSNPGVADTIRRLCLDGSNRQPKFIVPSIMDNLRSGKPAHGLALCSALWCRYCAGQTDAGDTITANDPQWSALQGIAKRAEQTPAVWLGQGEIYGDLGADAGFVAAFTKALQSLVEDGAEATMRMYLGGGEYSASDVGQQAAR